MAARGVHGAALQRGGGAAAKVQEAPRGHGLVSDPAEKLSSTFSSSYFHPETAAGFSAFFPAEFIPLSSSSSSPSSRRLRHHPLLCFSLSMGNSGSMCLTHPQISGLSSYRGPDSLVKILP